MNSNGEVPGGSAGDADKKNGNRPIVDKKAEARNGVGGEHKQARVKEGVSLGDQDDGETERRHEAANDDSVLVLPVCGDKEVPKYTGGYTVKRHGAFPGRGIASIASTGAASGCRNGEDGHTVAVDAVQLEFGSLLRRTSEARAVVAEAVATAIFDYLQNNQAERP